MKKLIFFVLLLGISMVSITGCQYANSVDAQQSSNQEQMAIDANNQIGMPAITNFTEKKLMKSIFELRDKADLICYCYIVPEMTGKPIFVGRCIGFGLPYSTQFTNPERLIHSSSGSITLPQADPNQLFMPDNAEGTWVRLINPKTGEPKLAYIESRVFISQFEL